MRMIEIARRVDMLTLVVKPDQIVAVWSLDESEAAEVNRRDGESDEALLDRLLDDVEEMLL